MSQNPKILVIIPARGGSVSIPRKNLQLLDGKPLLAWAIETAKKNAELCPYKDYRITVNTEDTEIADVAKEYGAEVFLRPIELAEDVPTEDVVLNQLKWYKKETEYIPDIFALIQCTTPLIDWTDINNCISGLYHDEKADSCVSMRAVTKYPQWFFKPFKGKHIFIESFPKGLVEPWLKKIVGWIGVRQKLPQLFIPNGGIYAHWTKRFLKHRSMFGKRVVAYVMPQERSLDIDEPFDLELLRALVEWRKKRDKKTKSKKKTNKGRN